MPKLKLILAVTCLALTSHLVLAQVSTSMTVGMPRVITADVSAEALAARLNAMELVNNAKIAGLENRLRRLEIGMSLLIIINVFGAVLTCWLLTKKDIRSARIISDGITAGPRM